VAEALAAEASWVDPLAEESLLVGGVYGLLMLVGLVVDVWLIRWWFSHRPPWVSRVNLMAWRPWSWPQARPVILLMLSLFLGFFMVQLLVLGVLGERFLLEPGTWVLIQSLIVHWPVLACLVIILSRRRISWARAFGIRGNHLLKDLGLGVLLYLAIIPPVAAGSWLYMFALQLFGYQPGLQDVALAITDESSFISQFYLFMLGMLIAPFYEELIFRGVALPLLVRRWGMLRALLFISFFFAVIHAHIPSFAGLFLLALALAGAYTWTGSLMVPIVMHSLFNAVNLGLLSYLRHGI
jgi:membrane protease YdiL (CAAX protease family)